MFRNLVFVFPGSWATSPQAIISHEGGVVVRRNDADDGAKMLQEDAYPSKSWMQMLADDLKSLGSPDQEEKLPALVQKSHKVVRNRSKEGGAAATQTSTREIGMAFNINYTIGDSVTHILDSVPLYEVDMDQGMQHYIRSTSLDPFEVIAGTIDGRNSPMGQYDDVAQKRADTCLEQLTVYAQLSGGRLKRDIEQKCSCLPRAEVPNLVWHSDPCPTQCAYAQSHSSDVCHKLCVQSTACPDFHPLRSTPDPIKKECVAPCGPDPEDLIPGCIECDMTAPVHRCHRCATGFSLSPNGAICWTTNYIIIAQYAIVVGTVVLMICYMVQLLCRKTMNKEMVFKLELFSQLCLPDIVFKSKSLGRLVSMKSSRWLSPGGAKKGMDDDGGGGMGFLFLSKFIQLTIFVALILAFLTTLIWSHYGIIEDDNGSKGVSKDQLAACDAARNASLRTPMMLLEMENYTRESSKHRALSFLEEADHQDEGFLSALLEATEKKIADITSDHNNRKPLFSHGTGIGSFFGGVYERFHQDFIERKTWRDRSGLPESVFQQTEGNQHGEKKLSDRSLATIALTTQRDRLRNQIEYLASKSNKLNVIKKAEADKASVQNDSDSTKTASDDSTKTKSNPAVPVAFGYSDHQRKALQAVEGFQDTESYFKNVTSVGHNLAEDLKRADSAAEVEEALRINATGEFLKDMYRGKVSGGTGYDIAELLPSTSAYEHSQALASGHNTTLANLVEKVAEGSAPLTRKKLYAQNMGVGLMGVYILTVLVTWYLAYWVSKTAHKLEGELNLPRQYTLRLTGLPSDITVDELREFLDRWLHHIPIVGVSIVYEYPDEIGSLLDRARTKMLQEAEARIPLDVRYKDGTEWKYKGEVPLMWFKNVGRWLSPTKRIDKFLGYGYCNDELMLNCDKLSHADELFLFRYLAKARGAGTAFVVFRYRESIKLFFQGGNTTDQIMTCRESYFRGKHKLNIELCADDPENLNWVKTFSWKRLIIGLIGLVLVATVYILALIPSTYLYLSYANVPGYAVGDLTDYLIGLIPAVGAYHIIRTANEIFEYIGFQHQQARNAIYMPVAFCAVCLMLAVDMGTTVVISYGKVLDSAFEGASGSFADIFGNETFEMLVPIFISSVLFMDVIFDYFLPKYVSHHVIRSRDAIPETKARDFVRPPYFDYAAAYVNIVVLFVAMSVCLPLRTKVAHQLAIWNLFGQVSLYLIYSHSIANKYMKQSLTSSAEIRAALHLWTVVPIFVLISALHWFRVGDMFVIKWPFDDCCAVAVHLIVYHTVLIAVKDAYEPHGSTHERPDVITYEEMMQERSEQNKPSSFFNANSIVCLRTKYLDESPFYQTENGLNVISKMDKDNTMRADEKLVMAQKHLDSLWRRRKNAGEEGTIIPLKVGYEWLQDGTPKTVICGRPLPSRDNVHRGAPEPEGLLGVLGAMVGVEPLPKTFEYVIPEDAEPGSTMQVQHPSFPGKKIEVLIPLTAKPGQKLVIPYDDEESEEEGDAANATDAANQDPEVQAANAAKSSTS